MSDNLEVWNNQEPENKNLESLSILIQQLLDVVRSLEDRIETLEAFHP